MEAIDLRQNLISTINRLPSDMLEELDKYINFLEYKKVVDADKSKEEILNNLKISATEIQMIREGKLKAKEALNSLLS